MRGCAPRRRRPRFCAAGGRALRRLRLLGLTYQRGTFESTCHAWHPCFTSQPVVDTHTLLHTHTQVPHYHSLHPSRIALPTEAAQDQPPRGAAAQLGLPDSAQAGRRPPAPGRAAGIAVRHSACALSTQRLRPLLICLVFGPQVFCCLLALLCFALLFGFQGKNFRMIWRG